MRQLLFRGQTRRKGEKVRLDGTPVESNWVYGGVMQGEGDHSIIYQTEPEFHKYPVYSDTLGQFTGLNDKNGTKIFEGDLIICNGGKKPLAVTYHNGCWECITTKKYPNVSADYRHRLEFDSEIEYEVVGNIYDDKESCNETSTK